MKNKTKVLGIEMNDLLRWFYFGIGFICGFGTDRNIVMGFIGLTTIMTMFFVIFTALVWKAAENAPKVTKPTNGAGKRKKRNKGI